VAEQTSTFVFADLAGFTALTEAHGDEHAADLAAEFCGAVRRVLADRDAEELKTIGDATMLRADDASEAVLVGLAILSDARGRERFPAVRVGMHTGSAVIRDGDWFGSAVNLAARVTSAAAGDEVLLTADTRAAATPVAGVEFEHRGRVRLKNVRDPVEIYRALGANGPRQPLRVDPVCRMTVAPEHCAGHLVHAGIDYCFCSLECAGAFARSPGRYIAEG
jgi:class 3 adenylate cyclase/YHS domain-containing protein